MRRPTAVTSHEWLHSAHRPLDSTRLSQVYWGPARQLTVGTRDSAGNADVAVLLADGTVWRALVPCTVGELWCALGCMPASYLAGTCCQVCEAALQARGVTISRPDMPCRHRGAVPATSQAAASAAAVSKPPSAATLTLTLAAYLPVSSAA